MKSFCSLPLLAHKRTLGALNVGRRRDDGFTLEDVELLSQVAQQVAIAVENALAYKQIAQLKDKLTEEKLYLEEEIQTDYNFEEIVGESRALKQVLKQVKTVASTDSTVLILGETGCGKELVARALHNLSTRRERTFVKLNCAAIPTGLLESELFGHEKGAFTGAIATKIGRFELADRERCSSTKWEKFPGASGQTPPGTPGAGIRTAGGHAYHSHECAGRRSHESRPRSNGGRAAVSQ